MSLQKSRVYQQLTHVTWLSMLQRNVPISTSKVWWPLEAMIMTIQLALILILLWVFQQHKNKPFSVTMIYNHRYVSKSVSSGMQYAHCSVSPAIMKQVMMLGDKCSMLKNVWNGIKGYIYDIPTIQFLTGIPRNTHISQNLICYHWLNVSGIS